MANGTPATTSTNTGPLGDRFGRTARDLRVSLTDHCNLRCTYCMPAEGLQWMNRAQMLTDEELVRVVAIFVHAGVTKIRLTGGEPLLRPGVPDLVRAFAQLTPRPDIAMTTNAIFLKKHATALAEAGLDRVNVSLDTIDPDIFHRLTRRNRLTDVIEGLHAAAEAGLTPIKINAVAMRGINDHGVTDLLAWCIERGYQLRFIEQMPLDAQHGWAREDMITAEELRKELQTRFTLTPLTENRGSSPAEHYLVDEGPATVGIIASVTAPFCHACDRVRLTADGMVRNCLFARGEMDLRTPLREGATDRELLSLIRGEMWRKLRGHGIGEPDFTQPARPMSSIGG
ncbi:GTP 3',8-cyclase MoaA [Dermatophilus congolensis]|uniref:GTP 3',8-cyclase n=1 Tax=Dermatophilus congolensis TaxID=1863 RepID=A0A239VN80_9MICO|nr:GTP 3',8-cyclase MoaA [Dermatophilus congolensis]MBO3129462.1 GTP 3',8-cyclase MoaA [Dermatophilus congolensis]MBO3131905.1 GTP 3',8-cyclase MoaA [Dermatophilus congolensis]MBO3133938.1 GTP 3',8-cyclase MoaA [Dermatophilus congolensis]MBO3136169.1 GTP 3',8-cyclase MoaA [Dermatophilus congolensis]MBO3138413.1 GTP 3',8-cyclase MoaA [Dermatophilus congolensis]